LSESYMLIYERQKPSTQVASSSEKVLQSELY
jgi:hypothetical protein